MTIFVSFSSFLFPLNKNFLGGGLSGYLDKPFLWAFVNFDGEHYLSIARQGYKPLTYFFFPLYPLIVRTVAYMTGAKSMEDMVVVGLLLSNVSFFIGLVGFWKLFLLDFKREVVLWGVIFLVFFPTSFYFASFYTESLFLSLAVWSFYFLRRKNYIISSLLAGLTTATRIVGLSFLPVFLALFLKSRSKKNLVKGTFSILLSVSGLIFYMFYLFTKTGNPIEFFTSVSIFGEQRQSSFILLPQVFYRYLFKIIPNLDYSYSPVVLTTFLEIGVAVVFFILSILAFYKLRLEYALYLLTSYIIPTFSGSFSSLPRYILLSFPAFILISSIFEKKKFLRIFCFASIFLLLFIYSSLFFRGYWVS